MRLSKKIGFAIGSLSLIAPSILTLSCFGGDEVPQEVREQMTKDIDAFQVYTGGSYATVPVLGNTGILTTTHDTLPAFVDKDSALDHAKVKAILGDTVTATALPAFKSKLTYKWTALSDTVKEKLPNEIKGIALPKDRIHGYLSFDFVYENYKGSFKVLVLRKATT